MTAVVASAADPRPVTFDLTPFGPSGRAHLAAWLAVRWWDCATRFLDPIVHVDELGIAPVAMYALALDVRQYAFRLADEQTESGAAAPVCPRALHALADRLTAAV